MAKEKILNVVISGEAGQGLLSVGNMLARSAVRSGYRIVVTQGYQSRIRGGCNSFAIRMGLTDIAAPRETHDILVALNAEAVETHRDDLSPGGVVVADAALNVGFDPARLVAAPFKELGKPKAGNVVAFGLVGALIGMNKQVLAHTLADFLGGKHPESLEENKRALDNAFTWVAVRAPSIERLPTVSGSPAKRMMMNGNEAIAMGALSSGLRFCAFYPMTPSTSINLTVIAHAKQMGVIVEQAEDEIAAANMAIGASFAGAPSMAATSGGGFALMTEAVSLAGQTETPLVVVVAQRPGPATGLPTRTEQGDLEFVLHAGHGEFPRAIYAPGSVEECFGLTRKAFLTAERFQSPVFVLTDQFLADSYRAVAPFDVDGLDTVNPGADPTAQSAPYLRYAPAADGVSPRLIPGMSKHLVVADSDEHTEDGRLTEDLAARKRMVEKRLKKHDGLCADAIAPERGGDSPADLLLVSWGSTKGAVAEAASIRRESGDRVGALHFGQVWPMVPGHFLDALRDAKRVVCVEGNVLGQLSRLIRRETGFEITSHIRRYDGLPITPEYVLRGLGNLER